MSRRGLAVIGTVVLVLAQLAGPALAHHGGRPIGSFSRCNRPVTPPRCSSVGDNPAHHVAFDATLTEGLRASLRDTLFEDYGPTKIVPFLDDEPGPLTDVIAFSEDYGENGAAGWVACPPDAPQGINPSGHRWCRSQELFFNLSPRYAVFFADDASRDHVACHELGHTLGLRHWGNPPESAGPPAQTCLNANTPNGPTGLHQIDIDHINAYLYETGVTTPPMQRFTLLALGSGSEVFASEVERAGSLAQMAASADAVVVATVAAVEPGPVFGGATGRPLHYAAVTLEVSDRLAGSSAGRVRLEVPLFDGPGSIGSLGATVGMEAVFFLRHKADADAYRLTRFGALVAAEGGVAVTTSGPDAIRALGGLAFGEALRAIQRAAGEAS